MLTRTEIEVINLHCERVSIASNAFDLKTMQ